MGDYHGDDRDNAYKYIMNVCGPCNTGGAECTEGGGILCQYENNEFIAVVASQLNTPVPTWSIQNPANPSQGVKLHAQNGAACDGSPRDVTFMFNCVPDAPLDGRFVVYEDASNMCVYHVNFDHPHACPLPDNYFPIENGVVNGPFALNKDVWGYYSIEVTEAYGELKLTLEQKSDDHGWVGLWVRRGAFPTKDSFDRFDNTPNSKYHMIEIRSNDRGTPLQPGTYYIGVQAQNTTVSAFTIQAELFQCPGNCSGHGVCNTATKQCSCSLGYVNDEEDCSAFTTIANLGTSYPATIKGTQKAYFRYNLNDSHADQLYIEMERNLETPSALPILMVQYSDWPTIEYNNGMVRDFNTPSQRWELIVEPPVLQDGVWIVGVQGSADQFFSFTITARVCDCPKCCSGHGTCQNALPQDYCVCDHGYQGTTDCSASTSYLIPNAPLNLTVDANGGTRFFEVDVPHEFAVAHVDMMINAMRHGDGSDGIRLYASPQFFPSESNYWFVSQLPISDTAQIIVPHADLYHDLWYIGVWNYANQPVPVSIELGYFGFCPCTFGQGYCLAGAPATCFCNPGWQGAACDVKAPSSSDDGVETGGVVAMVIIFALLGVAVGIFIKHKKPELCERNKSLRDELTNEDL